MNNITKVIIHHPYAYELMFEALNVCTAAYPLASKIKPVESIGLNGFVLEGDNLFYDPVAIMNEPFMELCHTVHCIYLSWYLKYIPVCSLTPLFNPNTQH